MAVVLLTAGCAQPVREPPVLRLTPAQAVFNAAAMPQGIAGEFEMVVRASGRQGGRLFLNSERDYRDPRNLTVVVLPMVEQALAERLGDAVEPAVRDRVIAVRGIARKTRIDFLEPSGRETGKYYFQTHLLLRSARDLTVSREAPPR